MTFQFRVQPLKEKEDYSVHATRFNNIDFKWKFILFLIFLLAKMSYSYGNIHLEIACT